MADQKVIVLVFTDADLNCFWFYIENVAEQKRNNEPKEIALTPYLLADAYQF